MPNLHLHDVLMSCEVIDVVCDDVGSCFDDDVDVDLMCYDDVEYIKRLK